LTHLECLDFARARWLSLEKDNEAVIKEVEKHFFASGLLGRRDDNAISRLWWNAYIANLAIPSPGLEALDMILKRADFRLNLVERSLTASRPVLAAGIVRIIKREETWMTAQETNFREFMKALNRLGGGMVFETMSEADVDSFMAQCAGRAGMSQTTAQ
jgi:hypothetical protein